MKLVRTLVFSVVAIITLAAIFVMFVLAKSTFATSGSYRFSGLSGEVTITRDHLGVPHIDAKHSESDAYFALGYVHAQDRFWQMEFQRRLAKGTLSEIFGNATLSVDKMTRTFGFYRAAQAAFPSFDPHTQKVIQSYTQGINAFLSQAHLPLQFSLLRYKPSPWTDIDSIVWQKMMAYDLQSVWKDKINNYIIANISGAREIAVLTPSYPVTAPTVLDNNDLAQSGLLSPQHLQRASAITQNQKTISSQGTSDLGDDNGKGSNNWVISGKRSSTGMPMLANDTHLSLSAPSLWYLAEIKAPGLHVTGATIPGIPGVVIGHNDFIAWGVTNVNPDTQDLYIESDSAPLKMYHEIIKVKDAPDENLVISYSSHGPIISDVTEAKKIGPRVALKWTALQPDDKTIQSILNINYATDWQTFVHALSDFVVPSQNYVYGDIKGNIGYYLPGRIPLRKEGDNGLPVIANGQHEWQGYIPFEQLPHVLNPSKQFIASANNKVVTEGYPYPLTYQWKEAAYRIVRIEEMLRAKPQLSLQELQRIQLDDLCALWLDWHHFLLATTPLDKASRLVLSVLKKWNGNTDLESIGSTAFAYWYRELTHLSGNRLAEIPTWNNPLFIKQQLSTDGPYCRSTTTTNCAQFLSQSLQRAANQLIKERGDNPNIWQWGKIHRAEFKELGLGASKIVGWLWNRRIAAPGGDQTVNVGTYNLENFYQTKGSNYRQIIDLSHFDQSLYMITMGQTDNPFNPHYDDLMRPWSEGHYISISSNPLSWGHTEVLSMGP